MKLRFSHFQFLRGAGQPGAGRSASRSGVALIVTIIMLSVITFLAVAFLALSGREKGSVKTATNQVTAKQAAEAGLERVKVELVAAMLATTNPANFRLLVSTNYINSAGFQPSPVDELTNISYTYANGTPISLADSRRLLTNLLYSPRAPVFITNRLVANSNEFRYYLDLNRNGRHDVSGTRPVLSDDPANPYFDTNGLRMPNIIAGNTLSNFFQGDPEWIGGLDRPNQPHGPENRFLYRYTYAVVPIGKTLDVNYIHNQALAASSGTMDNLGRDFSRNQGVGSWEINLAAFLHDLNTNVNFGWGNGLLGYSYDPFNGLFPPSGNAFVDAGGFYRYRVNGNQTLNYGLDSVSTLYGLVGNQTFQGDWVDGYTDSALLSTNGNKMPAHSYLVDDDTPGRPWVGADNTNHLFTTQDFFDRNKVNAPGPPLKFVDRLTILGTNASTYDQYTFYRLLEQLGTDSAPEDPDKLNLNYVNVGGLSATNFVQWTDPDLFGGNAGRNIPAFNVPGSVLFFTNTVDRLLRAYTTEWLTAESSRETYTNTFGTDQPFGVTGIPVYVNGRMVYSPAVQRILQMAANIWDAKTNLHDSFGPLPTVFRPYFTTVQTNSFRDVYISSFGEIRFTNEITRPVIDLTMGASNILADDVIYGVPLVIGARKGLPNFNEFAMDTMFTVERKLELVKSGPGGQTAITQTNQLYTLNIAVECGTEFWNSYRTNYTRPVSIVANNYLTMSLADSNYPSIVPIFKPVFASRATNTLLAPWPAWTDTEQDNSFIVPFRTNIAFFIPRTTGYWPGSANYVLLSASTPPYEVDSRLLMPNWSLEITNRVQAVIADGTGRIIDYVLLGEMTYRTNLVTLFGREATARSFAGVWATNAVGTQLSGRLGVVQQILIAMGNATVFNGNQPSDWESHYGTFSANRAYEIAKFGAFFLPSGSAGSFNDPATGEFASAVNTNLIAYAPFTASATFTIPMSWQANDPLVHYIGRDMLDLKSSGIPYRIKPTGNDNTNAMANIGLKNARYQPWAKDPGAIASDKDAFNPAIKDPLVRGSDDWEFPTNTLPTLGWLGRIHRGSPWQTIYLKASNLGITNLVSSPAVWALDSKSKKAADKWAKWTGNRTLQEGFYSRPVMDRLLFDVFTTALNDNASRGRLPINQSGLAAWSALFSGMVVLTNDATAAQLGADRRQFSPLIIQPAGAFDAFDDTTWLPLVRLVNGINQTRSNGNYFANGTFEHLGDILAVPELTDESPFLDRSTDYSRWRGVNDAAYEWLPQQMLSLVQLGTPRFVVYSYGQALQPAPDSVITSGTYSGLCTNYAIASEVALRAVVKMVGSPDPARTNSFLPLEKRYPPRAVIESFNYLGPE